MIRDILKKVQKIIASVLMTFMINGNENEAENKKIDHKDTTQIDPNILNVKCVSV